MEGILVISRLRIFMQIHIFTNEIAEMEYKRRFVSLGKYCNMYGILDDLLFWFSVFCAILCFLISCKHIKILGQVTRYGSLVVKDWSIFRGQYVLR